jgi:hypothetical protein
LDTDDTSISASSSIDRRDRPAAERVSPPL